MGKKINIDEDEDEALGRSTWESSSKRSWEDIQEEDGVLKVSHEDEELENHRRRRAKASDVVNQANIRKGLIRCHCFANNQKENATTTAV